VRVCCNYYYKFRDSREVSGIFEGRHSEDFIALITFSFDKQFCSFIRFVKAMALFLPLSFEQSQIINTT